MSFKYHPFAYEAGSTGKGSSITNSAKADSLVSGAFQAGLSIFKLSA
ncbi:hypothetical protein COLO4_00503 [Corchorus olitorius]|uniref:Uncharacterized protein n=1 Tax=Corchorus olitorius TaxID=93759 RepID=A0A1R3L3Q9_9ROSI|nr:hypothetical protein COLO4_00503 [Corchorus olitorius]